MRSIRSGLATSLLAVFSAATVLSQTPTSKDDGYVPAANVRDVLPTTADPGLKTNFDASNEVIVPPGKLKDDLVVFLPGTHGKPMDNLGMLKAIASGGYRVIGLMYDDIPTGESLCHPSPVANCGGRFREERVYGDASDAPISNTVEESIVYRLGKLIAYEARTNPTEGWGAYLSGDKPNWTPKWAKIIIAGHSQGAGHAAYIAKTNEVARVVLFSGGPDAAGGASGVSGPSPWVSEPSKTPADRWWAEYHAKEKAGALLPIGFAALRIPSAHVLRFELEPPSTIKAPGLLAYHMTVIADPRYLPQWKTMFGIGD